MSDLDGTLVLTEARNARAWSRFLARHDVPLTHGRLTAVTGRRDLDPLAEDSGAGVAALVAAGLTCVAVLTCATAAAVGAASAVLDDLTQVGRLGWSPPAGRS